MNEKQRQKWQKNRQKGQSYFVTNWGLFFLFVMGIFSPVFQIVYSYFANGFSFSFLDNSFLVKVFVWLFISFPLGCVIGLVLWYFEEFRFSKNNKK